MILGNNAVPHHRRTITKHTTMLAGSGQSGIDERADHSGLMTAKYIVWIISWLRLEKLMVSWLEIEVLA